MAWRENEARRCIRAEQRDHLSNSTERMASHGLCGPMTFQKASPLKSPRLLLPRSWRLTLQHRGLRGHPSWRYLSTWQGLETLATKSQCIIVFTKLACGHVSIGRFDCYLMEEDPAHCGHHRSLGCIRKLAQHEPVREPENSFRSLSLLSSSCLGSCPTLPPLSCCGSEASITAQNEARTMDITKPHQDKGGNTQNQSITSGVEVAISVNTKMIHLKVIPETVYVRAAQRKKQRSR